MDVEELQIYLSEKLIDDYAKVSKDTNPIHMDKNKALEMGFKNRVAHGMILLSITNKLITRILLDGWFVSVQELKFISPVLLHDTVVLKLDCIKDAPNTRTLRIVGFNDVDVKVLQGKMTLVRLDSD